MSNGEPPQPCLADFGFITTVLDSGQKTSCSAGIAGGTGRFMSPELLVPDKYGKEVARATPEADIYAFGMVVFQVGEQYREHRPLWYLLSPGPYG